MSVFLRRFTFDPGNEVLLEIESVNILDLTPPSSISGIGTGTAICLGEYENGDFSKVVEVTGATDVVNTVGSLGYTYGGVPGTYPCSIARRADGALTDEYWNGNAIVQLNAKKFKRLLCVRVDTSVGSVQLQRQAYVTGAAAFSYVVTNGQILALDIGGGPVNSTFSSAAAVYTTADGNYNTGFVGGETLTIGYDSAPDFTVTFLNSDQTRAQVISRINVYAGFTFAAAGAGAKIVYTGIVKGLSGAVRSTSASAGVFTALGMSATATAGTGNVNDSNAVVFSEIKAIVEAAVAGTTVQQNSAGALRISKNFVASGDYIQVTSGTTASTLGFTSGDQGSNDGFANYRSTAGTFVTGNSGTLVLGADSLPNFSVALLAGITQASAIASINAAAGFTMASSVSGTITLLRGQQNGGEVRVVSSTSAGLLTDLGFTVKTQANPGVLTGKVPAGTVVQNTAATRVFVLMQDVKVTGPAFAGVTASGAGPYTVKVRHAVDDGSGLSSNAGTITAFGTVPDLASFQVTNAQTITAALTETQIDAQYVLALAATLDLNTAARDANMIFSARQSNTIRRALRSNVLDASGKGMAGRVACIRTPMNTLKATALSRTAQPGVGAYRDQRVIYCYPQSNTFVPIIALRGLAGGKGFTADGNVDVGADGFLASIMSQLPPEENPGQETPFTTGVNSLETGANVQGFTMDDYKLFKAAGICAMRIDDGVAIFQSGVTSVDPQVYPGLATIARRRMADFIQDTLARRTKSYGKKLSTFLRRKAVSGEISVFLKGLRSENNPSSQRIDSYSVDDKGGNTATTLAMGLYRIIVKVRTLASLDSIVLQTTIGTDVQIDEILPNALAA